MKNAQTIRIKAKKGDPQRTIRFPQEMVDILIRRAYKSGRSINSEVIYRVAKGLDMSVLQQPEY